MFECLNVMRIVVRNPEFHVKLFYAGLNKNCVSASSIVIIAEYSKNKIKRKIVVFLQ